MQVGCKVQVIYVSHIVISWPAFHVQNVTKEGMYVQSLGLVLDKTAKNSCSVHFEMLVATIGIQTYGRF